MKWTLAIAVLPLTLTSIAVGHAAELAVAAERAQTGVHRSSRAVARAV